MIWQVQKNGSISQLVGTAHFFPYSFRNALRRCLQDARMVMFEGPLDDDSMARFRQAGMDSESAYHLFDELDDQTIAGITGALIPVCRMRNSTQFYEYCKDELRKTVYELVQGMQPWLAFLHYGPLICSALAGNIRSTCRDSMSLGKWAKIFYFLKVSKSK